MQAVLSYWKQKTCGKCRECDSSETSGNRTKILPDARILKRHLNCEGCEGIFLKEILVKNRFTSGHGICPICNKNLDAWVNIQEKKKRGVWAAIMEMERRMSHLESLGKPSPVKSETGPRLDAKEEYILQRAVARFSK
jgi:hypothetical protein